MFETTWRRFVAAVLLRPLSGWRTGDSPGQDDDHRGDVGIGDDGQGHHDVVGDGHFWSDHLDQVSWEDWWVEGVGQPLDLSLLAPEVKNLHGVAPFKL